MYDPYGYYKAKSVYSVDKNPNVPFYEDYPVNDSQWFIGENYVNLGTLKIPDYENELKIDQLAVVQKENQSLKEGAKAAHDKLEHH